MYYIYYCVSKYLYGGDGACAIVGEPCSGKRVGVLGTMHGVQGTMEGVLGTIPSVLGTMYGVLRTMQGALVIMLGSGHQSSARNTSSLIAPTSLHVQLERKDADEDILMHLHLRTFPRGRNRVL
jgi:hypothetical protein